MTALLLRAAAPVVALFLLSLAAVMVAFGQLHRPQSDQRTQTVRFVGWGRPDEEKIMRQALQEFEKRNPDLKVDYIQIPGVGFDYLNKVRLMLVSGLGPDVFYVPDGNFGELASRGALIPLDSYIQKGGVKVQEMWESGVARYRWDGHVLGRGSIYCLPKDVGPNAMFYNKDVLRKRGVPFPPHDRAMGWDEAVEFWKKLTYREANGVAHYGLTGYPYECAVWSTGGDILDTDRRTFILERSAPAVQWVADLGVKHGVIPAGNALAVDSAMNPDQLFQSQLAATHITGRWMVPGFRELPFDWDVAPIPAPKPGDTPICWSGSVGFGIPSNSKKPELGFRLIAFLSGPEGQEILASTGLQIPNQQAVVRNDPGQKPEHPEVFLEAARVGRAGPWAQTPNSFWHEVMWVKFGPMWRGEVSAAEHLPKIAPLINRVLREHNPQ